MIVSDKALIENNAKVAAELAVNLSKREKPNERIIQETKVSAKNKSVVS